eukprot:g2589.t1
MRAPVVSLFLSAASIAGASNLRTTEDAAGAAAPATATASVSAAQAAAQTLDSARSQFAEARGAAMKFTQANLGSAAIAGVGDAPKIYKVTPGVKGGLALAAAEGQNDPPVHIRARADYAEPVKEMSDFLASSSYQDDIKELLIEVDKSMNFMKGLKLRIAEKENFVDSLVSREDLLQADVNKDKQSLENLQSHVKAMRARVEKLKKTKQLAELQAQYDEYSSAAGQISAQAAQLNNVKSALKTKMSELAGERDHLGNMELSNLRESIDVGAGGPAASESAGTPASSGSSGTAGVVSGSSSSTEAGAEAGAEATDDANFFDPFGDEASIVTAESATAEKKGSADMMDELQAASDGLRKLQETRAQGLKLDEDEDKKTSETLLIIKDAEDRVISEAVKSLTQNMTEEMTAKEMDEFISRLPVEQLFKTFDLDGSGSIDFDEFSKMLPQLNIYLSEAQALKFFASIDQDGSGEIDQEEFCVLLIAATNATKGDTQNTIDHTVLTPWDAFQLFDEDGSNSIDFEEFNALCDYCGLHNIKEKQRMKNFKRFDEDGGGTLNFEEFKLCWILMTNPFHQAAAHGFEIKKWDTEAEMREKVMYRLEKLEEKDQISLVDAFRWVDYHREKLRLEREARDKKITSREYWAELPSSEWTTKLMIESLGKMGYDNNGKKEELEHRIRSYVNDAKTFGAWLWEVVEAVLDMTDSGFESWGGVYTCGHGANGQLGRPCDAVTSELSGDVCDLRAAGSRIVSGGWPDKDEEAIMFEKDPTYDPQRPGQRSRPFEGQGGIDMYSNFNLQPFIGVQSGAQYPEPNSSPKFQSIESLSSKGVDRIFASFCSELAFVQCTATGELWMLGGKRGKTRDYPIPIEEPEVDLALKDKPGAIYLSEAQRNPVVGLPFETFDTPTKITCFENQRLLSLGIGDDELLDRNEDSKIAAQQEEEFLRRPGGPILPNGSQTKPIDISRGIVVRHSGHGRTIVKDIGGRRTFFWDNESYLKESDQPMPVILDSIVIDVNGRRAFDVAAGSWHTLVILEVSRVEVEIL